MLSFGLTFARVVQGISRSWGNPYFRSTSSLAVLILLSGTLFYRSAEGWSWIDAIYFSVMTAATIGFGDLVPTTTASKVFAIFYAISTATSGRAGGLNAMGVILWKCGRALRAGVSPPGRVDSPWTTPGVAHRLPTLSRLSPTNPTGSTPTRFQFGGDGKKRKTGRFRLSPAGCRFRRLHKQRAQSRLRPSGGVAQFVVRQRWPASRASRGSRAA